MVTSMIIGFAGGVAARYALEWAWGKYGDTIKRKLLFWLPGPQ